jgi:peptide/nickel transport system ATP-binding protein
MKTLLEMKNVNIDFSTSNVHLQAISDVSLTIRVGETVCLVGESGSGKTVLSKMIMQLVESGHPRTGGTNEAVSW